MWFPRISLYFCLLLNLSCLTLQQSNAEKIDQVRQVLNEYAISLDNKDFKALSAVFTTDVKANYSTADGKLPLSGIPAIQNYLETSLAHVVHQHALTTQLIELTSHGASATTYFTATFFGIGAESSEYAIANGKYFDELLQQSKGGYKIWRRDMNFLGGSYIGNISIFA